MDCAAFQDPFGLQGVGDQRLGLIATRLAALALARRVLTILEVDSFSILFNHCSFQNQLFPWVFDGFPGCCDSLALARSDKETSSWMQGKQGWHMFQGILRHGFLYTGVLAYFRFPRIPAKSFSQLEGS